MNIGITYNLRSKYTEQENIPNDFYAEFDSEETIQYLEDTITSLGHTAFKIGDAIDLVNYIVNNRQTVDLVFNIAEGILGRSREAQVPAILEVFNIPYTFSDPLTTAVCLDKAMTKRLLQSAGLATPKFIVASKVSDAETVLNTLPIMPVFIKPLHEGTSKGVDAKSVIHTPSELSNRISEIISFYHQPAIVEEFLPGREFTVGILGCDLSAKVIGIAEIIQRDKDEKVYGFLQKEECEQRIIYESIEHSPLMEKISQLALDSYRTVGCRDAGRVDIRLDQAENPQVLEINPLPGMHPTHSDLPIIAEQSGLGYGQLVETILISATERISNAHKSNTAN